MTTEETRQLETAVKSILASYPGVYDATVEECTELVGIELLWSMVWSPLADTLAERFVQGQAPEAPDFLALVERLLAEGVGAVGDVVATYFLDAIMCNANSCPEAMRGLIELLGPESKFYCRAWDKIAGIKRPGL